MGREAGSHQGAITMCFLSRAAMKSPQVVAVSVHSSKLADALWNMSACTGKTKEQLSGTHGVVTAATAA